MATQKRLDMSLPSATLTLVLNTKRKAVKMSKDNCDMNVVASNNKIIIARIRDLKRAGIFKSTNFKNDSNTIKHFPLHALSEDFVTIKSCI